MTLSNGGQAAIAQVRAWASVISVLASVLVVPAAYWIMTETVAMGRELSELRGDLKSLRGAIVVTEDLRREQIGDHEARLRALERPPGRNGPYGWVPPPERDTYPRDR